MNYIRKNDLVNFQHLQIPKKIWNLFINKKISTSAFKVYVEFFERVKLSSFNNWIDNDGNVYIKYSYNELMEILSTKSKGTVANALEELKTLGLIIQEKRFNDTARYYLTNILNLDFSNLEEGKKEEEIPNKNDDEIVSPLSRPALVQEKGLQKSSFIDANNININNNNLKYNSLYDEPIFIQQILQKYNDLQLPKYEYRPSNHIILDCVNMFGIKDLFNALEVMSKSDFCMNNFSVNTIFKTENIKKALNGSFKNRVNKKDKKIIPINKNIEYSEDKTSELYKKLGI